MHYVLQPSGLYCTLDWTYPYFSTLTCILTLAITLALFTWSYIQLVLRLRAHALEWSCSGAFSTSDGTVDLVNWHKPKYCQLVAEKSLVLVLTFLANWSVYCVIIIYSMFAGRRVPFAVDCVGIVLVLNNPTCTFIYNMLLDKRWRAATREQLGLPPQSSSEDAEKGSDGPSGNPQVEMSRAGRADVVRQFNDSDATATDLVFINDGGDSSI
ncbi:hypothetical protein HKX48_008593 [Thoreauomyces humboldtii]|nr:hypothetical protein HKX48_008593 [Thoreauomyces humboldtii]